MSEDAVTKEHREGMLALGWYNKGFASGFEAGAKRMKGGWNMGRTPSGEIIVTHADFGGVVVEKNPLRAREIPESILWALADTMLKALGE